MTDTTFRLFIETDNYAETARILRNTADRLDAGEDFFYYRTLCDINGNDLGRAAFKARERR